MPNASGLELAERIGFYMSGCPSSTVLTDKGEGRFVRRSIWSSGEENQKLGHLPISDFA